MSGPYTFPSPRSPYTSRPLCVSEFMEIHVAGPYDCEDTMELRVASDGRAACEHCVVADRPLARLKGLLGKAELGPGEGVLLRPASSIHTWFMRFPIDAVFLDDDLVVLRVAADVGPWRVAGRRGSRAVLELAAGECERRGIRAGERLVLTP
jgi:uncharacterized membrane protein (UPF0127 family)